MKYLPTTCLFAFITLFFCINVSNVYAGQYNSTISSDNHTLTGHTLPSTGSYQLEYGTYPDIVHNGAGGVGPNFPQNVDLESYKQWGVNWYDIWTGDVWVSNNAYNPTAGDYFILYRYGDNNWKSIAPSTVTRIDNFTYSTTTQKFNIQGYFSATSSNIYDYLSITSYNDLYGTQLLYGLSAYATSTNLFNIDIPFTIYTATTTGTTTAPININTEVIANISSINNLTYDITNLASSTLYFTASTNGSVPLNNINDIFNYPEQSCSITNIIGCIKNAIVWAFWPTKASFTQFYAFQDNLRTKAPTGYFYVVRDNLLGLSTTTTPTFNIVLPVWLKNQLFNPIDLAVAGLLWFYYAVFLYKRIKHIDL